MTVFLLMYLFTSKICSVSLAHIILVKGASKLNLLYVYERSIIATEIALQCFLYVDRLLYSKPRYISFFFKFSIISYEKKFQNYNVASRTHSTIMTLSISIICTSFSRII